MIAFLLVGSLAYFTYTVADQQAMRNSALAKEVSVLQSNEAVLQGNLTLLRTSLAQEKVNQAFFYQQARLFQTLLQAEAANQSANSQKIADYRAALESAEAQLVKLSAQIAAVQNGNVTLLTQMSLELQNVTAQVRALESGFQSMPPVMFLRTFGTALASYVGGPDDLTYLRLTESGPTSGVEAAIGTQPFNSTLAGATVEWKSVANAVAADSNHWFWPMVLENSPGGTNAIEFEYASGVQEVAVVKDGVRITQPVQWDPTLPHTFKIVVVVPGGQVDYYIDGAKVASIYTGVPSVGFLLEGAEVKGDAARAPRVAVQDVYGGMLRNS